MKIFLLVVLCLTTIFAIGSEDIYNYKVINKEVIYQKSSYTLIRSFNIGVKIFYLGVDDNSLETKLIDDSAFILNNKKRKSRYKTLLLDYTKEPYSLQNYGVKSLKSKHIFLTIDMCPSSKVGYEDEFLNNLITHYYKNKALPITFFISGRWIKKHKKEFLELIKLQKEQKLDITWGNHTYNHFYYQNCALEKNFILAPNTDVKAEILKLEKLLLKYGVTPSILFRFPGLVSDKKSIKTLRTLGLIPVGSNAWLAKDESIKSGSVILLHGNKNEPKGIEIANELLIKRDDFTFGSILQEL